MGSAFFRKDEISKSLLQTSYGLNSLKGGYLGIRKRVLIIGVSRGILGV